MSEKIITVEGIGDVVLAKKSRIRRVSIRMRPFRNILLTVPSRVSEKDALDYLASKKEWILRTWPKIREMEEKSLEAQREMLERHREQIDLVHASVSTLRVSVRGERIRVSVPFHVDKSDPLVARAVSSGILLRMKRLASEKLPGRVAELASRFGFSFGKVSMKNMKTRWGSCTFRNDISLSIHLVTLPLHLQDYVILHELVHTRHKHHRREFWEKLESVCPGSRNNAQEIRSYRHLVLA